MAYGTTRMGILGAGGIPNLVTTLYTGTGAARDIITGQNQAAGCLNWIKSRSDTSAHELYDTERGATKWIESNSTSVQQTDALALSAFNGNGFSIGGGDSSVNLLGGDFVAWSFLQKAGFMDIVTGSGDGTSSKTYNHALGTGSAVGLIIAKRTDGVSNWVVFHKELGNTKGLYLNDTNQEITISTFWNNTSPTSTQFTVGSALNDSGTDNFIYYVFAHNPAQKIFCGRFTTDGSGNATITGLGFMPKWLLIKRSDASGNWILLDIERGWSSGNDAELQANTSDAEVSTADFGALASGGFTFLGSNNADYIYMAVG